MEKKREQELADQEAMRLYREFPGIFLRRSPHAPGRGRCI